MSDIECPHCDHEYDDDDGEMARAAAGVSNSQVDGECPECGEVFEVFVEWDPYYYPSKKG